MAKGRFIAYYRVSTDRQGKSGLGLEAQRQAVVDYLDGGRWELVGEHTEIESGRRNDRPELAKALDACRRQKAVLIIAKLDRLARNVAFIANLMESGVDFVAVDFPQANKLTIHILAAVAEHERQMISDRTKSALGAAKARGVKLGSPAPWRGSPIGAAVTKARADAFARNVLPIIREVRGAGVTSLSGVARALNARGVKTPRGRVWEATTVRNVLRRGDGVEWYGAVLAGHRPGG